MLGSVLRWRSMVIFDANVILRYLLDDNDFVDCVLYAYHRVNGAEIMTFDKKLLKLLMADEKAE